MAFCQACKKEMALFEMVEVAGTDTNICVACSKVAANRVAAHSWDPSEQKDDPAVVSERAALAAERHREVAQRAAAPFPDPNPDAREAEAREWGDFARALAWSLRQTERLAQEFANELAQQAMPGELWPPAGRPVCDGCDEVLPRAGSVWSTSEGARCTWRIFLSVGVGEMDCAICSHPTDLRARIRLAVDDLSTPGSVVGDRSEQFERVSSSAKVAVPLPVTHFFCGRCANYLRAKGEVKFKASGRLMTLVAPSAVPCSVVDLCMACGRSATATLVVQFGNWLQGQAND